MSKKKRTIEKQKKEQAKQKVRAAKQLRQKHDPSKWEEKKARRASSN